MKAIKYTITTLIILFCFLLTGELFQSNLQTFSNQFYYMEIENEDHSLICSTIISATEKYDQNVFAIDRRDIDAFHSQITIYTNDETRDNLFSDLDISEGTAHSLFSGTTQVIFRPFENVTENSNVKRYYFTGSKDEVSSIRQYINSKTATSYIHKEASVGTEKLIYFIWILSFSFILLLTWLDIQFSRKSDFLKISMGRSFGAIIWKNILLDLLFAVAVFIVSYLVLRNLIYINFKLDFAVYALVGFLVFNSLLYATIRNSDYKEIIYGANINGKLLANTYLLKAVVMIMLIISLSCNLVQIIQNAENLKPYSKIDKLNGFNTLNITLSTNAAADEESDNRLKMQMFIEAYRQDKVLIATSCAAFDEPIIVLNDVAINTVVSDPEVFNDETADFVVYIPECKAEIVDNDDIEFAARTTADNFFGLEDYSFDVAYYQHADVIYFDLRNTSELKFGFEMVSDPIVVCCNVSKQQLDLLTHEDTWVDFGDRWNNIIFNLSDSSAFDKQVTDCIETISFNSVVEQCNQYKSSLLRTVLINLIISGFLLILSILLVSVIVKMEYLINAKEIAIKKILGYSIVKRNSAVVLLNIFAVLIAIVTGFILSAMYEIFDIPTLCLVSVFVFALDTILILCNMAVAESKNTAHILKGGSL